MLALFFNLEDKENQLNVISLAESFNSNIREKER